VLGDITEEKDNHGAWLVNRVSDAFYDLAKGTEIIILRGNHDYQGSGFPFFSFLDMVENIWFISKPTTHKDSWFLPHTTNYRRDWDDLVFDTVRGMYVFAHNTFQGAFANGVAIPGIPPSFFPDGVYVIAGDIHTPQTHGNITYVGAPYTVDFGDDYNPRVLLMADNGKMESVPVPGPQKRLVILDRHGLPMNKKGVNKGDILKIRVGLAQQDYAKWAEIREQVRTMAIDQGYMVHAVEPIVQKQSKSEAVRRKMRRNESDEELLRRYAEMHNIDEKTLEVGLELL
jgi:hypothetical protein